MQVRVLFQTAKHLFLAAKQCLRPKSSSTIVVSSSMMLPPGSAPGVATALRARTLGRDHGSRSSCCRPGTGGNARPRPLEDRRHARLDICRAGSSAELAKLLHHDPVALDFVQAKLDRCGCLGRCHIGRFDRAGFRPCAATGRRASGASSGRRAWRGCLSCWSGGAAWREYSPRPAPHRVNRRSSIMPQSATPRRSALFTFDLGADLGTKKSSWIIYRSITNT